MRLSFPERYALIYAAAVAVAVGAILCLGWGDARGVFLVAFVAIGLGWLMSRRSARRLRHSIGRLRTAAEAVGSGDFRHRIAERPGDELAKVIDAFNRMADRLEKLADDEKRLRSRLDQAERLAALGELAATVAHEVNNPLDGIQNCTQIIRRDPRNVEQVRRMLDLMDEGLYRIEMIVRRLLSYGRDEAMNVVALPASEVVNDALLFVQPRLDKHRIRLVRTGLDRPVFLRADRMQLAQVLINLLLNAIDSTGPGGRVEIRVEPPADERGMVRLSVEDNGSGIAPELAGRIFEPFFSTKGPGTGTGLGLAVVKKIVEAHQGRVEMSSRLGEGTRFDLWLPAAPAGAPAGVGEAAGSEMTATV